MSQYLSSESPGVITDREWLNLLNLTESQRQGVANANDWTHDQAVRRLEHMATLARLTLESVTALRARLEGR